MDKVVKKDVQSNFLRYDDNWIHNYLNPILSSGAPSELVSEEMEKNSVGTDVYLMPIFSQRFCDTIVKMAEEMPEQNWTKGRHEHYPTNDILLKDFDARLEAINNETFCKALVAEARESGSCHIPLQRVYFLGLDKIPDHNSAQNLIELSKLASEHWSETFLRLSRESQGRGLFNWRMFSTNLKEQGDLFASEHLIPGLGDVGAHVSQIMDGGWASFILSHYVREKGVFTLPQAIKRMTADPAAVIGLKDRGILKTGMKADINVFNPEEVNELQPVLVNDFPGDAPRYIQKSRGFKATIVNGQVNVLDGEPTGARAGQVLRH